MGIAQRFRALDARLSRYATDSMKSGIGWPNPGWAPPAGYVGTSSSGVTINEDQANTVSAWFAGIRNISEDVAGLPLIVYRRDGESRTRATDHPWYRMLHDAPNPEMTSMVFRETLQAHAMAWGNGYAEKEVNSQGITLALWPLRPDRMEVRWEGGRRWYHYRPNVVGDVIRIPRERIFHLAGLGFDGLQGYSILHLARETLGQSVALREYGSRVLENDARPGVVLSHPGTLSKTARDNIADSWDANHRGFTNAARTAVLEEGIAVTTIGFPPEDVQFLESQRWQTSEVARWLRIAPHKIGDLERATFSNIEEQNIDHVTSTLRAWLVRWEQQLNKDVVTDPAMFAEHLMDALLRGKTLERAQAWTLKINAKAATPNEWRASDNQNPVDWGDQPVEGPNNTAPGAPPPMPTDSTPPTAPGGPTP
jgi:HK97 family phage portal protein